MAESAMAESAAAEDADALTVVTDWPALARLAPEWAALWQQTGTAYLIESAGWARLSWEMPPDEQRRQLFCIVGRRSGRLTLVWPSVIRRVGGWRQAQPLGTLWGDYSSVLTETEGAEARVAAAWRLLRRRCPADLIHLPFMRQSSVLHRVVTADSGPKLHLHDLPAPWVSWDDVPSWEAYLHARSATQRRDLDRKHRRLDEMAPLSFEEVTSADAARPVIDWLLHHKAAWLDRAHKADATWVREERFRRFLYELMAAFGEDRRCILFVLRQADRLVAADLCSIEGGRVGWYMGTFDQSLRKYSPGHVLKKFTLKWAFDRHLDFDMRLGGGEHKQFWCNRVETTATWRCAVSAWGSGYVLAKHAQPGLQRTLGRLRPARQPEVVAEAN